MIDACRWGILGSAGIAKKIWNAISASRGGVVTAVASRKAYRAEAFVDACQNETPMKLDPNADPPISQEVAAVGDYRELLQRDDVDAVYIPLPTGFRKKWVIAAAEAKKHILCEKPAAIHTDDLNEMLSACSTNGCQWMDGVMFDHSGRIQAIADQIRKGAIGSLRRIQSHFSFPTDESFKDNIRGQADAEPHGALGDLGWYGIRLSMWITGFANPQAVRARTHWWMESPAGNVPGEMQGQIEYENGICSDVFCSFRSSDQQTAIISGDKGYLSIEDYVLPFHGPRSQWRLTKNQVDIQGGNWAYCNRSFEHGHDEYSSLRSGSQEVNMIETFNQLVIDRVIDPEYARRSLLTQQIVDAMRESDANGGSTVTL